MRFVNNFHSGFYIFIRGRSITLSISNNFPYPLMVVFYYAIVFSYIDDTRKIKIHFILYSPCIMEILKSIKRERYR
jgi:hypothetical protein